MHAIIPLRPLIQSLDDPRSSCGIEEFFDGRLCSVFSLFLRQGLRRWSLVIIEVQPFVLFIMHFR